MAALWAEEIVPASYARHVYLVLHETAYQAFFLPLIRERLRKRESPLEMEATRLDFFQQLRERVRGVATIGAVPQLAMNLSLQPEMVRWMQEVRWGEGGVAVDTACSHSAFSYRTSSTSCPARSPQRPS